MEIWRGTCFVGCNIKARLPDGTRCGGFAVQMEYGRTLAADIRCPDAPNATLRVDNVSKGAASMGTLTPDTSFFEKQPIDIDAIIEKHAPNSET
ncbi:hypothetical protein [uncultured Tateyamaria sp.]|uniref:hypothetical protein n=1 Tax=uncultured Tateyamaria sp. TaxID=455651 RepID=UPI00261FE011|nr:hypothetical protein [uncultured Tateyamaria sp.]